MRKQVLNPGPLTALWLHPEFDRINKTPTVLPSASFLSKTHRADSLAVDGDADCVAWDFPRMGISQGYQQQESPTRPSDSETRPLQFLSAEARKRAFRATVPPHANFQASKEGCGRREGRVSAEKAVSVVPFEKNWFRDTDSVAKVHLTLDLVVTLGLRSAPILDTV